MATTKTYKVMPNLNFTKKFHKGTPSKMGQKFDLEKNMFYGTPIGAEHESEHRLFLKIF